MNTTSDTIIRDERNLFVHSNYSFYKAEYELWKNADLSNSLFNGAWFTDCTFENIKFNNADFEGARFNKCRFIECSFDNTDMHSIDFSNCIFEGGSLSDALINDATFYECKFLSCKYKGLVLTNSVFKKCSFDGFITEGCSITLNQFLDSEFKNSVFKNVFYYQLFNNCTFIDSCFEAYLLGHVYGLTEKNFKELNCTVMGRKVDCTLMDSLDEVYKIYEDRKMYLNICFLEFGVGNKISIDCFLSRFTAYLQRIFKEDLILKNEQIIFLKQIIERLYYEGKIVPETCFTVYDELLQIIDTYSNTHDLSWEKSVSYIRELRTTIFFIYTQLIDGQ